MLFDTDQTELAVAAAAAAVVVVVVVILVAVVVEVILDGAPQFVCSVRQTAGCCLCRQTH